MAFFKILTFGCKVNQYESAFIRESLIRGGWTEAGKEGVPDVVIVNTCMVTHEAQSQSRQAINRAYRENPKARIVASGCYAEILPDEVSRLNGVDLVAGNGLKSRIPAILAGEEGVENPPGCGFSRGDPLGHLPVEDFGNRTRAFLKIQDGCESYCSYCIVPYARGPLRSIDPSEAIRALQSLSEKGYKEVVLTGIHLGKYGVDLSPFSGLKSLLKLIAGEKLPIRIRLSSIEPNEVDWDLIEMVADEEWLCDHLHIPLQSGDDGILEKMNRRYRAKEYARVMERIRERIPLAAIGLDVMVGFPGEDEKAFANTRSLIHDLPATYLHVFPFSPRKGTPAADFPDRVAPGLIKKRAAELRALGQSKRAAFYESCIGKVLTVLIQERNSKMKGMAEGLSDNYLPVHFPSPEGPENTFVRVRVDGIGAGGVVGTVIK
ncbi:MAG: tRNA (N(6)-L-threonylcarbamoyladenosine(37)-C(2))-methylthiotransferase MtaB [Deltaproteobacteria bacterium HGW-Deltaproteobacteria-15]|jgi:threonylcarbamoyladenosine tRNA methylthiotransferase MtaB|nr:MAG: tRNA (N(6)-L-threonylcarbamoyladenosine(37)-C(2))-methylthiotransferase MtaB [Deltaproteobacteria bacterium HGW-Deltaproteobacteria-15]